MKKIIFATVILVAISITSFAGEKEVDMKLLKDLTTTLRSSVQVNWSDRDTYTKATFKFNDRIAYAFYGDGNDLIGFAVQFDKEDMPDVISNAVKSKYGDWQLIDAIVFIDPKGYINYYAQVQKANKGLALKITPNGDVSTYAKCAPYNK